MSSAAELFNTSIPFGDIVLRFVLAALAGAALGLERERRGNAAGLRTHMLVTLAAAVFTVVTLELAAVSADFGEEIQADTLRIVEAVTAGVAFLGAGAIIQSRARVKGLTTAAGLWLGGAVGVSAGAGLYGIAILATVMGVIIIGLLRVMERAIFKQPAKSKESVDE
jgi:putative Mg2+ transporter-C (MgtC) family protein